MVFTVCFVDKVKCPSLISIHKCSPQLTSHSLVTVSYLNCSARTGWSAMTFHPCPNGTYSYSITSETDNNNNKPMVFNEALWHNKRSQLKFREWSPGLKLQHLYLLHSLRKSLESSCLLSGFYGIGLRMLLGRTIIGLYVECLVPLYTGLKHKLWKLNQKKINFWIPSCTPARFFCNFVKSAKS